MTPFCAGSGLGYLGSAAVPRALFRREPILELVARRETALLRLEVRALGDQRAELCFEDTDSLRRSPRHTASRLRPTRWRAGKFIGGAWRWGARSMPRRIAALGTNDATRNRVSALLADRAAAPVRPFEQPSN